MGEAKRIEKLGLPTRQKKLN